MKEIEYFGCRILGLLELDWVQKEFNYKVSCMIGIVKTMKIWFYNHSLFNHNHNK